MKYLLVLLALTTTGAIAEDKLIRGPKKLEILTDPLIHKREKVAGGREGSGGGDAQLIRYLRGPVPRDADHKLPPGVSLEEYRALRLFYGSASWGLDVLTALQKLGFQFSAPLSPDDLKRARILLKSLHKQDHVSFSPTPLTDSDGTFRWATNHRDTQTILLNKQAWIYSGDNLRDSCAKVFGLPIEVGEIKPPAIQWPVHVISHCYRMMSAAIAVHEVLSLMDLESNGQYPYSASILAFVKNPVGVLESDRRQIANLIDSPALNQLESLPVSSPFEESDPVLTLVFAAYREKEQSIMGTVLRSANEQEQLHSPFGTVGYRVYHPLPGQPTIVSYFQQGQEIEFKPLLDSLARRAAAAGRSLTLNLPDRQTIYGLPHDDEILSINDYYRTHGYCTIERLSNAHQSMRDDRKDPLETRVANLLRLREGFKEVLGQISHQRTDNHYHVLVIDYVNNLTKDNLRLGVQPWDRKSRHLHTFAYYVYEYSKTEKRQFIETVALDLLLSLRGSLINATKDLKSEELSDSQRATVDEVDRWLGGTKLTLEIIGGLDRDIDHNDPASSSFKIRVKKEKAWGWTYRELEALAGESYNEYGVSIKISKKLPDGSFEITSLKPQDGRNVDQFRDSLNVAKIVEGTSQDPPPQRRIFNYLAGYLKSHPEEFTAGVCTDGVVLYNTVGTGNWALLAKYHDDVLSKYGAKTKTVFSAPRGDQAQLRKWVEASKITVTFPLK